MHDFHADMHDFHDFAPDEFDGFLPDGFAGENAEDWDAEDWDEHEWMEYVFTGYGDSGYETDCGDVPGFGVWGAPDVDHDDEDASINNFEFTPMSVDVSELSNLPFHEYWQYYWFIRREWEKEPIQEWDTESEDDM